VGVGRLGRLDDLLLGRTVLAERNVLLDRAREEHGLLPNEADLAAEPGQVELFDVDAVEQDCALLGIVEALD